MRYAMREGRREFLVGLASALVTGAGTYGGYMWARGRECTEAVVADPSPPPARELFEQAWVRAHIGQRGEGSGLRFDRRTPFGEVREQLLAQPGELVWVGVELHEQGGPQTTRVPIHLDRGPQPGLFDEDEQERQRRARIEVMPLPRSYLAVRLQADATVLESGSQSERLPALEGAEARSGQWDGTMWELANRGAVSRIYGRTPWLFVDDELRWEQTLSALEALAPVRCQPHNTPSSACVEPWARLFVG